MSKELDKSFPYLQTGLDPAIPAESLDSLCEYLTKIHAYSEEIHCDESEGRKIRWQDDVICNIVKEKSLVLDLGCGGGNLLEKLIVEIKAHAQGVELDYLSVLKCMERGVPVFHSDLENGLTFFKDKSFDYVILEETLQTLMSPVSVLNEMLRIGKVGIVTFPNFGYWKVRMNLAVTGRMPVTRWLPYNWFDTPNIHLFTLTDLQEWLNVEGAQIIEGYTLSSGEVRKLKEDDNLFAEEVLLVIKGHD